MKPTLQKYLGMRHHMTATGIIRVAAGHVDSLTENNFRRVPITKEGRLMGAVSRSNLIDAILKLKHQESLN